MTHELAPAGTMLARGSGTSSQDPAAARGAQAPPPSTVPCWPGWARDQLLEAVAVAQRAPAGTNVATLLHREWFSARLESALLQNTALLRSPRPLAGVYRAAHAGSGVRHTIGGFTVLARHDVVAADGWWRTWGESWTPPRSRPHPVRLLLTPQPGRLAAFVRTITGALLDSSVPWSLACATRPARMRRTGGAVLQLPDLDALPDGLLEQLTGLLHPATPPLCAPLAPGAGLSIAPTNGMSFGEHRCHLVALGLRQAAAADDPLGAIASVFAAHGVRPAAPWRGR